MAPHGREDNEEEVSLAPPSPSPSPQKKNAHEVLTNPALPLLPCQMNTGAGQQIPSTNNTEMKYLNEGYLKVYKGGQPRSKKQAKEKDFSSASNDDKNVKQGGYIPEAVIIDYNKKPVTKKAKRDKKNVSRLEVCER